MTELENNRDQRPQRKHCYNVNFHVSIFVLFGGEKIGTFLQKDDSVHRLLILCQLCPQ